MHNLIFNKFLASDSLPFDIYHVDIYHTYIYLYLYICKYDEDSIYHIELLNVNSKNLACGWRNSLAVVKILAALTEDLGSFPKTDGSQQYVNSVPVYLVPSYGLCRYCRNLVQRHTCRQST